MEPRDHPFFRITSILMIIGGTVGIILGVGAVLGAGTLAAVLGSEASFGLLMVASIAVWASGVAGLIAGITGVKSAAKPKKAIACIVFGILTAALCALGNILAVIGGGRLSMVNLVTGLLLPVSYLIGNGQK